VNQLVANTGHFTPWDFRKTGLYFLGDPLGCLADDFQGANDRIGGFVIPRKPSRSMPKTKSSALRLAFSMSSK